jgi:hypothetical protein
MKLSISRSFLAAVFAAAVATLSPLGGIPPAAARTLTGWTVVPTPSPSAQSNYLSAMDALSPTDMWAVGAWYRPSTSTPGTLTEHWNGSTWSLVPSPNFNEGYNELYGVAAFSSTDAWAVGYHNISYYGSEKTMAQHWDGTRWRIVPTRNIGQNANMLLAVDGVASNDVWAVGMGNSTSDQVGLPLIQHWDGTAWSLSRPPRLGRGFSSLNGVVAIASDDVWAVGVHNDATLVLHWDGATWSAVSSPNGSRPDSYLYSVSATGPDDVWAVGETLGNFSGDTLVEHWDGASWTVVPTGDGSLPFTQLSHVAALGSSDVWAVGTDYDNIAVSYRTFTEHWDGSAWTVVPSPNPGPEYDFLIGATGFPGGDVWAVGAADEDILALRSTG